MTEESIKLLKQLRTFHNGTYAKAIDEAIASVDLNSDIISRREALEICKKAMIPEEMSGNMIYLGIKNLHSAEHEPLTDREQRIFLSAMHREMKVCKEVDEEYPRKDSLVKVCKEIERKVRSTLWT